MLTRLPGKLVVDHIGKLLGPTQPDSDAFVSLRRLLDKGNW
jgi:D-galactarolactone isomerase